MEFSVLLDGNCKEAFNCVLGLGYFVMTKIYGRLAWIHELCDNIVVYFWLFIFGEI